MDAGGDRHWRCWRSRKKGFLEGFRDRHAGEDGRGLGAVPDVFSVELKSFF